MNNFIGNRHLQLAATCDGGQHEYDEDRFEDQALIKLNPEKYSKNLKKYGTLEPPKIPNSKITVPVKLYTSIGDFVVPVKVCPSFLESVKDLRGGLSKNWIRFC